MAAPDRQLMQSFRVTRDEDDREIRQSGMNRPHQALLAMYRRSP
jgi:hypothetical protein